MTALILYHLYTEQINALIEFPHTNVCRLYVCRETLMYVDPITRQTFNYATPIECGNNPQNIIELDPDTDD